LTDPHGDGLSFSLVAVRAEDFRGAIVADLPRGRIETRDHTRLVALPADWFATLVEHTPAGSAGALGATLGSALEADARAALASEQEPSPDEVAYALSAALALRGLGTLRVECWGDALALVWRDMPGGGEAWEELGAAALGALVGRLTGLEVACAPVGREGNELRVLLGSRAVCDMARERAKQGEAFPQILARLERRAEGA
jgi:uncharacterized membrane protein